MRIAIIINFFGNIGGAAGVAYDQAIGLKRLGYDVTVFTVGNKEGWSEEYGLKVFRVKIADTRWIFRAYIGLRNIAVEKKFQKFLATTQPKVVHFHNLYFYLPFSLIKIAKKFGGKVFYTAHDSMLISQQKLYHFIDGRYDLKNIDTVDYHLSLWEQLRQNGKAWNPLRNFFIRHYLSYADKVIAVSNELKKALGQNGIHNAVTVYNGIDIESWSAKQKEFEPLIKKYGLTGKKVILLAGRLSYQKGFDEALRALRLTVDTIPEAMFLVVGSGYEYASNLIDELGLRANIVLVGSVNRDEMRLYYHLSDVVIMPSLCLETFGMVALEAMACAKPVVGTVFGGVREVVQDDVTGYIVNPLRTKDFSSKLIDLLTNSEHAQIFGEAGRERARRGFSLDSQVKEYLSYFNS